MTFSERYGHKPVKVDIQIESIDEPLRNGLWSLLKLHIWDSAESSTYRYGRFLSGNKLHKTLFERLWLHYFKEPLDYLSDDIDKKVLPYLREYFFSCSWHEVYDFIEFVANNFNKYGFRDNFVSDCNFVLEREISAYRFVDGLITQITSNEEVLAIETAIETSAGAVNNHLRRSLELLSDRNSPDYRNSIKESISAVESFAGITLGTTKASLGDLLKKLDTQVNAHPSLLAAFTKLYGYTSDEGGIRHAMTGLDNTDFVDAKFMLVACSAFINYLEGKLSK